MMGLAAFLAIVVTGLSLATLGLTDPKRRRARRLRPPRSEPRIFRRAALAAALCPGGVLLASGQSAAFLLWLGGSVIIGWGTSLVLSLPAGVAAD